jgi:hypothetical protein
MAPESEWFRPPKFIEYSPPADYIMYVWFAEPQHPHHRFGEKGCFGVSYKVTDELLLRANEPKEMLKLLKEAALRELHRRIADPQKWALPEGCRYDDMLWNPVLERLVNPDGTAVIRVQEPQ